MKAPVRRDLAMTGEITLRGRVLPIGGLKRSFLPLIVAASHGHHSKENRRDLREVPRRVLKMTRVVLVDHVDEVLRERWWCPMRMRL